MVCLTKSSKANSDRLCPIRCIRIYLQIREYMMELLRLQQLEGRPGSFPHAQSTLNLKFTGLSGLERYPSLRDCNDSKEEVRTFGFPSSLSDMSPIWAVDRPSLRLRAVTGSLLVLYCSSVG
jgi:hypothetical protein